MAALSQTNDERISALTAHTWSPQPAPAKWVHEVLEDAVRKNSFLATLRRQMFEQSGTRLLDWIDHFALPTGDEALDELSRVGYEPDTSVPKVRAWKHSLGLFPRVRIHVGKTRQVVLKVEAVADFLAAHNLSNVAIQGAALASVRRARVAQDNGVEVWVLERHGSLAFEPNLDKVVPLDAIAKHSEAMQLRQRDFEDSADGFALAGRLADASIAELGRDRTCELFFSAERDYWQRRNRAGRKQRERQESLGLGWANHDHHTYRSSRAQFARLITFLERLGFQLRERFYAGREAGWGAQVLEHPVTGVTIFADVDLSPEEVSQDFSHEPLPSRDELGTVGLWCELHGEAFLQAGLHHLECQFDFTATRDQLDEVGILTMPPFTDLPYLRQAFTKGETWPVKPQRVERLLASKQITAEQAQQFLSNGAIGSHLEILQRDDGYKGFNQHGINEIISATDPRRA
ncbi:MAG: hypothetical protein ACKV2Q_36040 [Planctomycetaceae bacterium]